DILWDQLYWHCLVAYLSHSQQPCPSEPGAPCSLPHQSLQSWSLSRLCYPCLLPSRHPPQLCPSPSNPPPQQSPNPALHKTFVGGSPLLSGSSRSSLQLQVYLPIRRP